MSDGLPPLQAIASGIVRVIVRSRTTREPMIGTGFAINPTTVVTAAHVLFHHTDLRALAKELQKKTAEKRNPPRLLSSYQQQTIQSVHCEDHRGKRLNIGHVSMDPNADIAILQVPTARLRPLLIGHDASPGESVWIAGYDYMVQNASIRWPLSWRCGTISTHANMQIGGTARRRFLVINSLALGGLSGGPVIDAAGTVVGLVHGGMTWGNTGFLRQNQRQKVQPEELWIPLPLTFCSDASFLRRHLKKLPT